MKITLVIFFLGIQSSYSQNIEESAEGPADTIQWVITEDKVWRVKTFAMDQDVHVYLIAKDADPTFDYVSLAHSNTAKHYGDVVVGVSTLQTDEGRAGIEAELAALGLDVHLNAAPSGLIFWSPKGTNYVTKSQP